MSSFCSNNNHNNNNNTTDSNGELIVNSFHSKLLDTLNTIKTLNKYDKNNCKWINRFIETFENHTDVTQGEIKMINKYLKPFIKSTHGYYSQYYYQVAENIDTLKNAQIELNKHMNNINKNAKNYTKTIENQLNEAHTTINYFIKQYENIINDINNKSKYIENDINNIIDSQKTIYTHQICDYELSYKDNIIDKYIKLKLLAENMNKTLHTIDFLQYLMIACVIKSETFTVTKIDKKLLYIITEFMENRLINRKQWNINKNGNYYNGYFQLRNDISNIKDFLISYPNELSNENIIKFKNSNNYGTTNSNSHFYLLCNNSHQKKQWIIFDINYNIINKYSCYGIFYCDKRLQLITKQDMELKKFVNEINNCIENKKYKKTNTNNINININKRKRKSEKEIIDLISIKDDDDDNDDVKNINKGNRKFKNNTDIDMNKENENILEMDKNIISKNKLKPHMLNLGSDSDESSSVDFWMTK